MVAQNVLIWAAPLHNIEKSLGVPNGGSACGYPAGLVSLAARS
jgi:hypothetical protein